MHEELIKKYSPKIKKAFMQIHKKSDIDAREDLEKSLSFAPNYVQSVWHQLSTANEFYPEISHAYCKILNDNITAGDFVYLADELDTSYFDYPMIRFSNIRPYWYAVLYDTSNF